MDTLSAPTTTNTLPLPSPHGVDTPPNNTTTNSSSSNNNNHTSSTITSHKGKHTKVEENKAAKKKEVHQVSATQCANCGTTTTPLWRRAPNGNTICNACGLYFKARNHFRPPSLKRKDDQHPQQQQQQQQSFLLNGSTNDCGSGPESGTCPGGGQCNGSGGSESCAGCPAFNQHQVNRHALICANCRTTTTPLWRRDEAGNTICNACGLYYKLHNMHRPVSMKRNVIKRRRRVVVAEVDDSTGDGGNNNHEGEEDEGEDEGEEEEQPRVHKEEEPTPASAEKDRQEHHQPRTVKKQSKRFKAATQHQMAGKEEVPAIEDYIVPRRREPTPPTLSSSSPPPPLVAPRPRLPHPSSGIESLLLAAEVDDHYHHHHPHPLLPPPAPPLPQEQKQQQPQPHHLHQLPPISLPPLSSSLTDFDDAIERLVSLRRQPSSHHVLLQLIPNLQDLVRRAEAASIHHPPQHTTPL